MKSHAIVAGAGPAGLTCALYLARAGWTVDVFSNEESTESCLMEASSIFNYPGFPAGIGGAELLQLFVSQAEQNGVAIHPEGISLVRSDEKLVIDTNGAEHSYDEYVEAVGCRRREFHCDGIELLPVHSCAICDGSLYGKSDHVVVIGGGDTAVSSALYLSNLVSQVTMLVRKPQCKCTNQVALNNLLAKDNVEIMFNSTLERIDKDALGNAILHVAKANHYVDTMLLGVSAIFACIGSDPNVIDHAGEGRIWKCGDCIEESKQVAVAVGSGAGVALRMIAE